MADRLSISESSSLSSSSEDGEGSSEDIPDQLQDLLLNDIEVSGREFGRGVLLFRLRAQL